MPGEPRSGGRRRPRSRRLARGLGGEGEEDEEDEEDDAFAGTGTDVGVRADDPDAENRLHRIFEQFPPVSDQFESDLFDEVAAPVGVLDLSESLSPPASARP